MQHIHTKKHHSAFFFLKKNQSLIYTKQKYFVKNTGESVVRREPSYTWWEGNLVGLQGKEYRGSSEN